MNGAGSGESSSSAANRRCRRSRWLFHLLFSTRHFWFVSATCPLFFSTRHFWFMSATPKCTFNFYAGSRFDGTRCCERADESSGGGNDVFLLQGATLRRARKGVRRGDPMVEFHRDVSPADMDSPGPTPSERPLRPQSSAKRASSLLSVPWRFFSSRFLCN